MKRLNRILLVVATATGLGLATSALAQLQTGSNDGIAASPKVRQMMNEHKAAGAVVATPMRTATPKACCEEQSLAASPKVRQMLGETPKCCVRAGVETKAAAGTKAEHGMAVSP